MSSLSSPHGGRSGPGWDQALPCLLRIVAACPPSRLMRVCVTYTKTFPGHGRSPTSNLLDDTRVPVITPGTPEANGPRELKGADAAWTDERGTSDEGRRPGPREPKGAAPPGLRSDEGATREGGASRAPGGEWGK